MAFDDRPQLPLTGRRKLLTSVGAVLFGIQVCAAVAVAPFVTGEDHADAAALGFLWLASIGWSVAAVLLIVRQADLPDVATASFLVVIAAHTVFAMVAAIAARGSTAEVNIVDAMFLGVTVGAISALIVWAIAMGVARILRLPTTAQLAE